MPDLIPVPELDEARQDKRATGLHLLRYLQQLSDASLESIELVIGSDLDGSKIIALRLPEHKPLPSPLAPTASLLRYQESCRQEDVPAIRRKAKKESKYSSETVKVTATAVIAKLNELVGGSFRPESIDTIRNVESLLRSGHSTDEMIRVLVSKYGEWKDDPEMSKFLRPSTLLRPSNFERYLNDAPVPVESAECQGPWQGSGSW